MHPPAKSLPHRLKLLLRQILRHHPLELMRQIRWQTLRQTLPHLKTRKTHKTHKQHRPQQRPKRLHQVNHRRRVDPGGGRAGRMTRKPA
jgi:hypothetical protein